MSWSRGLCLSLAERTQGDLCTDHSRRQMKTSRSGDDVAASQLGCRSVTTDEMIGTKGWR